METLKYKTTSANKFTVSKEWLLVDVAGINLGRACSEISKLLRGKHKPNFTPHVDCGDYVIVINASKINLTGKKWKQKKYISHSGYPGGQKIISVENQFNKNPNKIIEKSVKGTCVKIFKFPFRLSETYAVEVLLVDAIFDTSMSADPNSTLSI